MRNKPTYYIFTFATVVFISCGTYNNKTVTAVNSTKTTLKVDSLQRDTVQLKETFNQEDLPVNEYLTERLKPIRANFKRIKLTQLQTGQSLNPKTFGKRLKEAKQNFII
jgi:Zn-dependent M32 family carboxypeptidase